MASVITLAFENWKAQEAASGKAVLLDEFVFANVPNLDPTKPIDRNEKLPPANQIVHRQAVNKAGLASENAVAYSVTMGADVGNFDFNWIGLLNKASGTVAMVTHAPTQKKLKNQNGQQGNVLTRSFILEFQGAAKETQITTTAETWQIDFTARLSGIDEMQRLINVDSYGAAAFFDESFEVTRSSEQFTVKKGLGYVGGLRGELAQNQILNGLRNTKVYADFSYQGNIVSQWNTVVKITAAATLNNYVDAAGFTHQVFAIASIDASGNVKDLRPMGALSSQEISALETRFKLDLSKKIDKANITNQTGNSSELVASQNLVTTETGKKLDKSGGEVTGTLNVQRLESNRLSGANKQIMSASTNAVYVGNPTDVSEVRLQTNNGNVRVDVGSASYSVYHEANVRKDPKGYLCGLSSNGEVLLVGENGIGTEVTFKNVPRDSEGWPFVGIGGGQMLSPPNSAAFQAVLCWTKGGTFRLSGRTSNASGTPGDFVEFYSTGNTSIDRNGYVCTKTATEPMQSVPIGASVIWNTSAPIPSNFWPNEGRSFSAAEYPELAKVFTNLRLPDDRGYGIRVADNGRGIDAGRTVGSYQEDAMQAVTGSIRNLSATSADYQYSGAFFGSDKGGIEYAAGSSAQRYRTLEMDISRVARTANETRMKNVAKILITRVK